MIWFSKLSDKKRQQISGYQLVFYIKALEITHNLKQLSLYATCVKLRREGIIPIREDVCGDKCHKSVAVSPAI